MSKRVKEEKKMSRRVKEEKKMSRRVKEANAHARLVEIEGYQPTSLRSSKVIPPKTGSNVEPAPASEINIAMNSISATLLADQMSESPWGDLPPTQQKIHEIMGAMKDLLLYKNQKYGDSALNPIGIFTKHLKTVDEKTASILVRIDDKLSRVKNADTLRKNDICDLIGYLTLLNIAIGTTAEDIEKFKD